MCPKCGTNLHSSKGAMNPLHARKVLQILDSLLDGNSSQLMRNPLQPLHALLQSKRHLCERLG